MKKKNNHKPNSEKEFLDRFGNKWFKTAILKLLRIEEQWEKLIGTNSDDMPQWADFALGKLLDVFNVKPSKPEFMDAEQFGKLLGSKFLMASSMEWWIKAFEVGNPERKAKITKFFGGSEGIDLLKQQRPCAKRVLDLNHGMFRRVNQLSFVERGHFFRGYGNGMLLGQALAAWKDNPKKKKHHAYMMAFAVTYWPDIEEKRQKGWDEISKFFIEMLPKDIEISEDAFSKFLKRSGMLSAGKIGRPSKVGQKSSLLS